MDLSDKDRSDDRHSRPLSGLGWSMIPPLSPFPLSLAAFRRNIAANSIAQ